MANFSKNHRLALTHPLGGMTGVSLTELLIAVTILVVVATIALFVFKPQTQLQKARDARRKADLSLLKNKLDDYYNDKGAYPISDNCGSGTCAGNFTCTDANPLSGYLAKIPCDPRGGDYCYTSACSGQWYRIYTKLEYEKDLVIASLGCQVGCGPQGAYNYGVTSSNTSLVVTGPTPTPTGIPLPTRCPGWSPPSCANPQAYCPPQGGTACCAPRALFCSGPDYWCCP